MDKHNANPDPKHVYYANGISLKPNRPVHVATVWAHIGDVVVLLEVLRSRDGSLHVGWPDRVEVPPDLRAEVEVDVLSSYDLEEGAERYLQEEGRSGTEVAV